MHRQRKKDLNLKPNRVLDKRSSRGMIYENEELRLRTLAIADDVDRGQNDIRKLRKENEHLKREIWALRDECEKLEETLKRVVALGNFDPENLPYPDLFLEEGFEDFLQSGEGEEGGSLGSYYLESGDEREGSGSRNGVDFPLEGEAAPSGNPPLEPLKEESESLQSGETVIERGARGESETGTIQFSLPDPEGVDFEALEEAGLTPPVIQITPATGGSNQGEGQEVKEGESEGEKREKPSEIQEGGIVTIVPETYHSTSEIHIEGERPQSSLPERNSNFGGKAISGVETEQTRNPSYRHSMHAFSEGRRNCHSNYNFCQSEPALTISPSRVCKCMLEDPLLLTSNREFSANPGSFSIFREKELIVGTVKPLLVNGKTSFKSQQVLEQVEASFPLEKVKRIRSLRDAVFLQLAQEEDVPAFLSAFKEGLIITMDKGSKGKVTFHKGEECVSELQLSSIPEEVSDSAVIGKMNQFGQLVSPVERRDFKGVAVWERRVRLVRVRRMEDPVQIGSVLVNWTVENEKEGFFLDLSQEQVNLNEEVKLTPNQNQGQPSVEPVVQKSVAKRCNSSNPKLEGGASVGGMSPIPERRQQSASICTANMSQEEHPARIFQKNPKILKKASNSSNISSTNGNGINSAPNLSPTPKKPLTRLLKSSPGCLVPPNPEALAENQQVQQTPPVRSYQRNMSISNHSRRGSAVSEANPWRRNSNAFYSRWASFREHQRLAQKNSNNSSASNPSQGGIPKGEPLPWCGCWGNGCI